MNNLLIDLGLKGYYWTSVYQSNINNNLISYSINFNEFTLFGFDVCFTLLILVFPMDTKV